MNSLEKFIKGIEPTLGPLSTEVVASCQRHMEELAAAPATEDWIVALHTENPEHKELYVDPNYGFNLLAHYEQEGRYRRPHDHGLGWVVYAVQRGEIEMGTFIRVEDADGKVRLVKRDATRLRAGDVKAFMPGDIHDTLCIKGPVTLLRLTDRDLLKEEHETDRLTRYVEVDGVWTVKPRD